MIEDCFRAMKSMLEARPVFHWTVKRIKGHFVSFFVGRMLETMLRKKGMEANADRIMDAIDKAVLCPLKWTAGNIS
jgi:transposase